MSKFLLEMSFVQSAERLDQLPHSPAEVVFIGRSNVGKSSLINSLAASKKLAKVSKAPGRTRLLNLFEVAAKSEPKPTVVDCPGYGYAKVPGQMRQSWQHMIDEYLLGREQLEMIILLVDGEIGPTKLDAQMLSWLRANELPHTVVATKHDKVKSSARQRRKRDLAEGCQLEASDVVWVSAEKGVGLDRLRSLIKQWLLIKP